MSTVEANPVDDTQPRGWYTRDGTLRGSDKPIPGKCGRKLPRTDPPRYCMSNPLKGKTACRKHGGRTPGGIASPHFVNGAKSKYFAHLPKDLQKNFAKAASDEEFLSLRDELHVLTSRLMQLMDRLGEVKIPPWGKALSALDWLLKAKGAEATENALEDLEQVLREGLDASKVQATIWGELRELIQEKVRASAAEWKRLSDLQGVVTVEQALSFAKMFLLAAKEVVTDRDMLRRLQEKTLYLLPPAEK